jgi:hypothetical protein
MVRFLRTITPVGLLTLAACSAPPQPSTIVKAEAPEPAVTLQVVKWPELAKAIASHKGKVVVLDIWAEY